MKYILVIGVVFILLNIPLVFAENTSITEGIELPSSFCWRDVNGMDFTTSIKNQEPAPTCEAYALVAALETMVQYTLGYPFACDLSEAHLFFNSGGTCKWGVDVKDAADYLVKYGVPDEGCYPDPHRPYDSMLESIAGWENRTVKIQGWGWVENDEAAIKQALIDHGPLVICIVVWSNFYRYCNGIYFPEWGLLRGGHLITIVGYNDSQHCWLGKNSWGTSWGEDGWLRIGYDSEFLRPMFIFPFYGGTGILYLEGVYGNLMPDVPKIYIDSPKRHHTYVFGREFPTLLKRMIVIHKGVPRILGPVEVKINATNTDKVEFYLDGVLEYVADDPPFEWKLEACFGVHTLETFAYNEHNKVSKDIMDVFMLL